MEMTTGDLTIEVVCRHLPGICFMDPHDPGAEKREPVYLGIQKGNEVIEAVPADRKQVIFRPTFRITKQADGSPNFLGPFAKGTAQERFFYLSWGVMHEQRGFQMFRRAKIHLNHLTWAQVHAALSDNRALKVVIDMTGKRGDPVCASIRSDRADWRL